MKTDTIATVEYFDDRFYKLQLTDGNKVETVFYPSVTTKLGIVNEPFLARWRGDIGNELADYRSNKAKQMGSRIHEAIHQLFLGETVALDDYEQSEWVQLMRFVDWHKNFKPKNCEAEHTVFSLEDKYAGTLDLLSEIREGKYNIGLAKPVEIRGGIYIWDWKTGKSISNKYFYQLGAYAKAKTEMTGIEIAGAGILHLQAGTKSGWKAIMITANELKAHYETFRHAAAIWDRENENLTPAIFDMPREIKLEE